MKPAKLISVLLTAFFAFFLAMNPAAAGDAKKGKRVFNKCKACHDNRPGKNRVGPTLFGIVGRKAGTVPKYSYLGMKGADWTWNEKLLMEYLKDPKKFIQKRGKNRTKMMFKLTDKKQREDVIAYLKTLK